MEKDLETLVLITNEDGETFVIPFKSREELFNHFLECEYHDSENSLEFLKDFPKSSGMIRESEALLLVNGIPTIPTFEINWKL